MERDLSNQLCEMAHGVALLPHAAAAHQADGCTAGAGQAWVHESHPSIFAQRCRMLFKFGNRAALKLVKRAAEQEAHPHMLR